MWKMTTVLDVLHLCICYVTNQFLVHRKEEVKVFANLNTDRVKCPGHNLVLFPPYHQCFLLNLHMDCDYFLHGCTQMKDEKVPDS